MKRVKRIVFVGVTLLAVSTLVFALSGCGGKKAATSQGASSTSADSGGAPAKRKGFGGGIGEKMREGQGGQQTPATEAPASQ